MGDAAPSRPSTTDVGVGLRLSPTDAVMEGVHAPARIRLVAARPGAQDGEAWAVGRSNARRPGFDAARIRSSTSGGQDVFLRYTHATGWRIVSVPDTPETNFPFQTITVAANGEGWAGTANGRFYHRVPGSDQWLHEPAFDALTAGGAVLSISLGVDADGATYGFAVPEVAASQSRLLVLRDGTWTSVPFSLGSDRPSLRSVSAAGPDEAWVVGYAAKAVPPAPSETAQYLVVERWSSTAGWQRQLTGWSILDEGRPAVQETQRQLDLRFQSAGPKITTWGDDVWVSANVKRVDLLAKPTSSVPPGTVPPGFVSLDSVFGGTLDTFSVQPALVRLPRAAGGGSSAIHCPPLPRISVEGAGTEIALCPKRLPLTTTLLDIQAVDGAVMAVTTTGILRYTAGRGWQREATATLAATGGSFGSADEGWLATNATTGDPAYTHLGHWTRRPSPSSVRRWPQPATSPLEAVSVVPGRHDRALAVGSDGAAIAPAGDGGWDVLVTGTSSDLYAVAWADPDTAWAVGQNGTVLSYRPGAGTGGGTWTPTGQPACTCDLRGVVFDGAGRGWAVGTGGTILAFDGTAWAKEAAPAEVGGVALHAVAVAGADVIAVGDEGTILVRTSDGIWTRKPLPEVLSYGPSRSQLPSLNAVAGLRDGRAYIGGSTSVLLERDRAGAFSATTLPPLEGSIHSLAVADGSDGRAPTLVATVGLQETRIGDGTGWAFVLEEGGWRELHPNRASGGSSGAAYGRDTAVLRDPVRGVALAPDGSGWAVGGLAVRGANDQEGHGGPSGATSSLWRLATAKGSEPGPSPREATAPPLASPDDVAVAFVGDSPCASGLCSVTNGAGTRADAMLKAAVTAVDREAKRGAVDMVVSGGSQRTLGLYDELHPIAALFDELTVPWFGAMGARDIVGQTVAATSPPTPYVTTPDFALGAWRDRLSPWGSTDEGRAAATIRPVSDTAGSARAVRDDLARSHYAFDYLVDGAEALRVIVLDTSRIPLVTSKQNPDENQVDWLARMLAGTTTPARSWPAMVVMSRPLVAGVSDDPLAVSDASAVTAALVAGQAGAVVAGHLPTNKLLDVGAGVGPAVASGALGSLNPEVPTQGGYNAWVLVTFPRSAGNSPVKERGSVKVVPILESVALHAPVRDQAAGRTLQFTGVGRVPDAGTGAPGSATSGGPSYLTFPFPRACPQPGASAADGTCRDLLAAPPDHTFRCEDTTVCDFVRRSVNPLDPPGTPFRDPATSRTVPDPSSGLMCARNPGSTFVRLEAGPVAARVPVTVTPRVDGPCAMVPPAKPAQAPPATVPPQPEPVAQKTVRPAPPASPAKTPATPVKAPPVKPFAKPIQPMPLPEPLPVVAETPSIVPRGQPSTQPAPNIVVGAAVPPVANATPAPPGGSGSPGAAHQKEEEVQVEMASMEMRDARDVLPGVPLHTAAAVLAGTIATAFMTARRRRLPTAAAAAPFRPAPLAPHRRRRHQGARPR